MGLKETIVDFLKLDELKSNFLKLIEAKFELKKLEIQEKVEKAAAKFVVKIIIGAFCFLIFVLLNVMIANYLHIWLGNNWAGYSILILLYSISAYIIYANASKIESIVADKINEAIENQNKGQ